MNTSKNFSTIDEYINAQPTDKKKILMEIRKIIKHAVPELEEKISYQMPTFFLHENIVHFALNKNNLGFYPTPSAIIRFSKELSSYKTSKGAGNLPLDKPRPEKLIIEIVRFRAEEAIKRAEAKKRVSKNKASRQ